MADDRVPLANRTSPRQKVQGDHPGSMLSFASGSAIKRITVGVKARRWFSLPGLLRRPAFTLLVYSLSNEKEKLLSMGWARGHPPYGLAGIKGLPGIRWSSSRVVAILA